MNPTECPICGTADKTAHRYPCTSRTTASDDPFGPVIRNGREYNMARDTETGLMFVFADGVKIGQSQTIEAARLIRRNHSRRVTPTPWAHEPPTPR